MKTLKLSLTTVVHTLWKTHPPMVVGAALYAAMTVFFIAGIFLDDRYISGAPAWLKPTKFAISSMLYTLTIVWMLGFVKGRPRFVRTIGWISGLALLTELVIIPLQAGRGTTSHFNVGTTLNAHLFYTMGLAILVLWLTHVVITVLLMMQRLDQSDLALSLRLALVITLIGMSVGILMTTPLGALLASGQGVTPVPFPTGVSGAHTIGVPDGGAGLPIVGWSTTGGDLRVGHFIGLHALQVLPLLSWLLTRNPHLNMRQRVLLVWTFGLGYLALTLILTWQALRAQPLLSPDPLTLSVLSGLLLIMGASIFLITRPVRRWSST
ncbi:hypothetical protein MF271_00835 (plasmid) [Deinococcus sp. KNUC1210]|uniref:hypothetical protein n=1 Tax=Deinococcus sp. KNUC1210 TaxID=2917691 RepID=UPI001EEFD9FF|nr:hypothetical protein [Deinococcus sp. KNUC1210]ULH14057.1 hypothetical protein MF271_00835 [Deinococcus sp. KNUC1210]